MAIDFNALLNKHVDDLLAADAVTDDAAMAAAKADFQVRLDATIAFERAKTAAVQALLDDCRAGTPPPPPPPPPIDPPPSDAPFIWLGLQTPQLRKEWFLANTGPRIADSELTPAANNTPSGTVEGKIFIGTVYPASNAVLKNCLILINGVGHGIDAQGKSNVTAQHCHIQATGNTNRQQGVLGNVKAIRCDISGFEDGFRPTGSGGWALQESYVHDLSTASGAHNDGGQVFSGPGIIERNYIVSRDTSAIMLQSITNETSNAPGNVIVRHNYLEGGSIPLRVEVECAGKNNQAYENIIKKSRWGSTEPPKYFWADLAGASVKHGNIDSVTGGPIN